MEVVITIAVVIIVGLYLFFGIRWGHRFVDGRWNWLEKPELKILKIVISVVIGTTFGIVMIFAAILKLVSKIFTMFD